MCLSFFFSVTVADRSLTAFNDLKLGRKYKFVIFTLNDEKTQIVVEQTSTEQEYDAFLEKLPENECRYAVYDFEYDIGGGEVKDPKLSFHLVPRHRSSQSKDGLRFLQGFFEKRALNGVAADVQGTDFSEVAYDAVHEKVSRGTIRYEMCTFLPSLFSITLSCNFKSMAIK